MAMHRWRNYAFRYALEAGDFLFLARTEKSKDMNDISTTTNPVPTISGHLTCIPCFSISPPLRWMYSLYWFYPFWRITMETFAAKNSSFSWWFSAIFSFFAIIVCNQLLLFSLLWRLFFFALCFNDVQSAVQFLSVCWHFVQSRVANE